MKSDQPAVSISSGGHFLSSAPGTFSRWIQQPPSPLWLCCDGRGQPGIIGAVDLHLMGHILGHVPTVVVKVASEGFISIHTGQYLRHFQELTLPLKMFSVKLQNVLVLFFLGFLKF